MIRLSRPGARPSRALLGVLFSAGVAVAGSPVATPAEIKGADLRLLDEVRRVAAKLEALAGEKFSRPPIAVRAPVDGQRAAAEIRLGKILSSRRLDARGRAWADLGLGTGDAPRRLYAALARDLEGVVVDPTQPRLLVDPERFTDDDFAPADEEQGASSLLLLTGVRPDEPPVVHGLVHLLQRQRSAEAWPETTDRLLAARAWAEGEANLLAIRYVFESMGLQDEIEPERIDPGDVLEGRLLPPARDGLDGPAARLLDWVYLDGYLQAAAAYREGGREGLRKAMAGRRNSRDVMHLDRSPLEVPAIPEPDPGLSDAFSLVDRDSLGEQGVVVLVASLTGKENLGLIAGDGWSGDALFRWEGADAGDGVTEWVTSWISAEKARDFDYGLRRALEARFPGGILEKIDDHRVRIRAPGRLAVLTVENREVRLRLSPLTKTSAPASGTALSGS